MIKKVDPLWRGFFYGENMLQNFTTQQNKLYIGGISAEELINTYGSSLYVYDAAIIKRQYLNLIENITYPRLQMHYACKANTNPEIMKFLHKEGTAIEVMSPGEIELARQVGYDNNEIIFTCSNISREELAAMIQKQMVINLDSLTQIKQYGEIAPGNDISLRVNQGIGAGGHEHMITGGPKSKFGIDVRLLPEAQVLAKKYQLRIIGLHQHIGSDILDEKIFIKAMNALLHTAKAFPELTFLDFGGGFGIPYREDQQALNMQRLGKKITQTLTSFMKDYGRELLIRFEPGRYLVGESGVLLAKVTDIKRNPERTFVGVDAGFNQLIRQAMYGSYQQIVNASRIEGDTEVISVAGNICESGDLFARDREITKFKEGDIAAILDSGAYGYTMSSRYNLRSHPAEVLIENGTSRLIRERIG